MTRVYRRRKLMRTLASLALTATSATALMAAQHGPAAAVPGAPEPAPIIWSEDFEDVTVEDPNDVEPLPEYAGGAYTADPYWVNLEVCNGMVLNGMTTEAQMTEVGCDALNTGAAADWAAAIGGLNGNGDANYTLANWTSPVPPDQMSAVPGIVVQSPAITVIPGHYLDLRFNHVGLGCGGSPNLALAVEYQGTEEQIVPVNPCEPEQGAAGTSSGLWRVPAGVTEISYVIRNTSTATVGNDFAVDDLTVRDLTPQLSQTFDPTEAMTGDPVTTTYTVTNTGDPSVGEPIAAKNNFSFTDRLPDGLRIVELGDTDCGDGMLSPAPDEERVVFEGGDLADGQEFCTITLTVTSDEAATYRNPHILRETDGVVPHDTTTVTFIADEEPVEEDEDPIFVAPDTGSTR